MFKLFNLDSPFMRVLTRLTDMVIMSLLWLACCLPVITIGPSTAALYTVALKLARKEEIKVTTTFFQGFKKNFKQGVLLNLIFIVVGAVLFFDYLYMSAIDTASGAVASGCFVALGIWFLCIMFYTYPLQAQFKNTIRRTLLNAAILSMRKIVDTAVVFVLNLLPIITAYASVKLLSTLELFVRTIPVWVLLAPGAIAYFCAQRFVKLFAPYLPPVEEEEPEEE